MVLLTKVSMPNGLTFTNFGVVECQATRMLIGADGDILLAGYTNDFIALARYTSNGTTDTFLAPMEKC